MAGPAEPPSEPAPLRAVTEQREAVHALAADLLGFDTQNPPGQTSELVDFLSDYLAELGLDVERHATDPAKPNLHATLPGASERVLCLQGHADTVTYDADAWEHDPLGEWEDDRLYGRGATDMKGPLAAMIGAVRAYVESGTEPPVTLHLCVVSDEETGGNAGLSTMLSTDRVDADACVIGETTCEAGRHSVTVADRGSIWLTIEATGESAHGSRPMLGTNAIDRLYDGIGTLRAEFGSRRLAIDAAVEPIVEESVEYYEPTLGRETARNLFEHPTINLGTIEGGEAVNTVPATARAAVDIRLTAGVDTSEMLASIRKCVEGCEGLTLADVSWSVGSYEDLESPLVSAVADVAAAVTDARIYRRSATGGGDAKSLRQAGVPTVEFGLGTDTVHAVDEYTTRAALDGNAAIYTRLPYAFARAHEETAQSR